MCVIIALFFENIVHKLYAWVISNNFVVNVCNSIEYVSSWISYYCVGFFSATLNILIFHNWVFYCITIDVLKTYGEVIPQVLVTEHSKIPWEVM